MKIKDEHYKYMKHEIDATLDKYPDLVSEYESGNFPRADKVKDLQKRFCFDVMYGAGLTKWVCDNLYGYMHDSHIYTALKSICPKVTRNY
jgi:hypothetical protein